MATYIEELNTIQIQQLEHDERFPKEITNLNIHQRLVHMTLHFAKYNGQLIQFIENPTRENQKQSIVDTFIIITTCANILNIRLSDFFDDGEEECTLEILTKWLDENNSIPADTIIYHNTIAIGRMAKAMESLDHLEAFDYKGTIIQSIKMLTINILRLAYRHDIDLVSEIPIRLNIVKNRSVFKNKLKTHEERLHDYGYAHGDYVGKCGRCKEDMYNVAKRSLTCKDCAEELLELEDSE